MSPPPDDRLHTHQAPQAQAAVEATFGAAGPLLTEVETAQLLGVSPRTLQNWRRTGRGPVHVRLGGLVRYTPADVETFIAASRRTASSSSDARAARTDPLQTAQAQPTPTDSAADKPDSDSGLSLIVRAMMRSQKTDDA